MQTRQLVRRLSPLAVAAGLVLPSVAALGADQNQQREKIRSEAQQHVRDRERRQIYGSQLMSQKERQQYRQQMQQAKTRQEREQLRLEHHRKMQQRARQMGVTLPDMPRGTGMGPGQGKRSGRMRRDPGEGMGPGVGPGMDPGGGRSR